MYSGPVFFDSQCTFFCTAKLGLGKTMSVTFRSSHWYQFSLSVLHSYASSQDRPICLSYGVNSVFFLSLFTPSLHLVLFTFQATKLVSAFTITHLQYVLKPSRSSFFDNEFQFLCCIRVINSRIFRHAKNFAFRVCYLNTSNWPV